MARKTQIVKIETEGRDKGKIFHIREMPAAQAERWATRALLAVARSGVDIGNLQGAGMAGIAVLGIKALAHVRYEEVEPLLSEMFSCVQIQPDPRQPNIVRYLVDMTGDGDDIEEVATRLQLRQAILELHLGFLIAGANSISSPTPPTPAVSPTIRTSRKPSRQQLAPGLRR